MNVKTLMVVCMCTLALVFAPTLASAEAPGVRLQVTSSALSKAARAFLPGVVNKLQKIVIPHQKSSHYSVDPIKLTKLGYGSVNVPSGNGYVGANINGLKINMERTAFSVFAKVGPVHITCRGHASAEMRNTDMKLKIYLSNSGGTPTAKVDSDLKIGSFSIHRSWTNGGCKIAEKFVSIFTGDLNKILVKAVRDQAGPALKSAIGPAVNNALKQLVLMQKVANPDIMVYYDLRGPITINGSGVSIGVNGYVNSASSPKSFPFGRAVNDAHGLTRDIELNIQDYSINTASENLASRISGSVDWVTTQSIAALPVVGPLIYGQCPTCRFVIRYSVSQAPLFDTNSSKGIEVDAKEVSVGIAVKNGSGTVVKSLDVYAEIVASAKPFLNDRATQVTASYAAKTFKISRLESYLGPIEVQFVNPLLKRIIDEVLVPQANQRFNKFPLPGIPSTFARVSAVSNSFGPHLLNLLCNVDFNNRLENERILAAIAEEQAASGLSIEADGEIVTEVFEINEEYTILSDEDIPMTDDFAMDTADLDAFQALFDRMLESLAHDEGM